MIINLTVESVNFVNVATAYTEGFDSDILTDVIDNPNTTINGNTQFTMLGGTGERDTIYTVNESASYIANLLSNVTTTRDKAMSGDMVVVITPATKTTAATGAAWTRDVLISVQTAAGDVHAWLNHAYTAKLSIANTSTADTATIVSTTLTLVNGQATVVVSGNAMAWLAAETDTLTLASLTIMGYTVAGGTSVETFS